MTDGAPEPAVDDGRRAGVTCRACHGDDLSLDVDPVDDVLYIHCDECGEDIGAANVLYGEFHVGHGTTDSDSIDPSIRDQVSDLAGGTLRKVLDRTPGGDDR